MNDEIGNPVVIKANFNISGFLNATYGINIASNVNVFLHNVQLSHYNNSMIQPILKNEGNLVLSDCEISGNIQSVVKNEAGLIKVVNNTVIR